MNARRLLCDFPGLRICFEIAIVVPARAVCLIPSDLGPRGPHLIRDYGWYLNKARGMRKKAEAGAADKSSPEVDAQRQAPGCCDQTWPMLIKRVCEIDPMVCPKCGDQMKVVAFIEPPQREAIEKILRHSGLWQSSTARAPPDVDELVHELDYVDIDAFRATF